MVSFDTDILLTDPARIAFGTAEEKPVEGAADNPEGSACQASLMAFQSALVWRNVFTALTAVVGAVTAIAVAYCIYKLTVDGWDATGTLAAAGGAVTGTATVFLRGERSRAIKVLDASLDHVGTYCGAPVKQQLAG